ENHESRWRKARAHREGSKYRKSDSCEDFFRARGPPARRPQPATARRRARSDFSRKQAGKRPRSNASPDKPSSRQPEPRTELAIRCVRAGRPHDSRQDAGATPTRLGVLFPPLYTGTVKIALGQINPTVGDFSGNAGKIIDFAHQAQAAGAGLILFPELSVCVYPPRDLV